MYHDQVLTPMKTLFKFDAINLTIGLPFIRISPIMALILICRAKIFQILLLYFALCDLLTNYHYDKTKKKFRSEFFK